MGRSLHILQIGRTGQLARAMAEQASRAGVRLTILGRGQVDLAVPGEAARAVYAADADLVVIAAAYTAVDPAEREERLARRVNAESPGEIAAACAARGLPLIHISTDYVFDGAADRPWREDDPVRPLSAYGRTKAAGECAVLRAWPNAAVVRASWVFSPWGRNFVTTMLRLAQARDAVSVVADQRGRPTAAHDLAAALLAMSPRLVSGDGPYGLFHFANDGETDWAGFAEAVFASARTRGLPTASVTRIATADYPTAARRPMVSTLDTTRIKAAFGITPRPWRTALNETLDRIAAHGSSSAA